ncbi:MAG TPA: hypothetical protein VGG64_21545, partial [Pirellulales bacterium]
MRNRLPCPHAALCNQDSQPAVPGLLDRIAPLKAGMLSLQSARWPAEFALVVVLLSTGTGLSANPLRADDSPTTAEAQIALPAEIMLVTGEPPAAAHEIAPPEEDMKMPPSHPTRVEVDIEVVGVSQIQDHDQKFDVEFNAYFVWNDPRLAFDSKKSGLTKKVLPTEGLWTPDPLLVDELDVDARGGATAHVQPDGTVYLNRYYRGTITGTFDLHEFPLDNHALEVALEATGFETDEVTFVAGEAEAVNAAHAVPH